MNKSLKLGLIIGLSLIISSLILGAFFFQAQKTQHTIKVVGMASQQFTADTIKWRGTLEADVGANELKGGYQKLQNQTNGLLSELKSRGVKIGNIIQKPVNVFKEYNYNGGKTGKEKVFTGYRLTKSFYIISDKVEQIEDLAFNPIQLYDKKIVINNSDLQYYSSKIDELKKDIIAKATVNAKERAQKMLEDTDVKLGKMLTIDSGVFQITEPFSTRVSSGGIYDTSTKEKQIKVTVHAIFELK